jgi:DNA-binding response OmpR family regulator
MNKRILIIDDDRDLCLLLKGHLQKKQHIVYIAHTLESGIGKLRLLAPDILILDNMLPDGSGWTQADTIHELVPGMHMILISAYHTPKELLFGNNMPVTILPKPLSLKQLDSVLRGAATDV